MPIAFTISLVVDQPISCGAVLLTTCVTPSFHRAHGLCSTSLARLLLKGGASPGYSSEAFRGSRNHLHLTLPPSLMPTSFSHAVRYFQIGYFAAPTARSEAVRCSFRESIAVPSQHLRIHFSPVACYAAAAALACLAFLNAIALIYHRYARNRSQTCLRCVRLTR
jgi:hypothetical protein